MLRNNDNTKMSHRDDNMEEEDYLLQKNREVTRRNSRIFREGESHAIHRVLEKVDGIAEKRKMQGFHEGNFTLGVLNVLLVTIVFCAHPQHFWLLYLVEGPCLVAASFRLNLRAKPLNEALYYLDFCWIINLLGFAILVSLVLHPLFAVDSEKYHLPEFIRKDLYLAFLGVGCGPLLGATAILPFVAALFHDVRSMTNMFTHLFAPMVLYTWQWHGDEVRRAWPTVFRLDYLDNVDFFPDTLWNGLLWKQHTVVGNSTALYLIWWVTYTGWQLFIGLDLPRKVRHTKDGDTPRLAMYDTVFHSTVRNGLCVLIGTTLWNRPRDVSLEQMKNDDYETRDLLAYMVAHLLAYFISLMALAYPCHCNQYFHAACLAGCTILCVYRGAQRYTYYTTTMYGKMIRKQFAALAMEDGLTPDQGPEKEKKK